MLLMQKSDENFKDNIEVFLEFSLMIFETLPEMLDGHILGCVKFRVEDIFEDVRLKNIKELPIDQW